MNKFKSFDLSKQRPKVLLIGNGLLYGTENAVSWDEFIIDCSKKDNESLRVANDTSIPYTIRASAAILNDDKARREKYSEKLDGKPYESIEYLRNLLALDFDAILTTNYTYELEYELDNRFTKYSKGYIGEKYSISKNKKRDSNGPIIYTFNRIIGDYGCKDVWHMHGEARLKSSIVLVHDEYGRLIQRILNYLKDHENKYQRDYNNLTFESWIDYLIMGDVYVLGLGYCFSEFDLWWLLNRRMREKAETGDFYFYEPLKKKEQSKINVLKAMNVVCKNFQIEVDDNKDSTIQVKNQYKLFYQKAIEDIKSNIIGEK